VRSGVEIGRCLPYAERLSDLGRLQPQVVAKHEDRALFRREAAEAALELVAVREGARGVGHGRLDREHANVRIPRSGPPCLGVTGMHEGPVQPDLEPLRIAEPRQLTPGDHQRLLHGILGSAEVAEDPLRERNEPVAVRTGQHRERLPVPTTRLLNEVAIHVPPSLGWRPAGTPSASPERTCGDLVQSSSRRQAVAPSAGSRSHVLTQ
jgi:hypothetical protein